MRGFLLPSILLASLALACSGQSSGPPGSGSSVSAGAASTAGNPAPAKPENPDAPADPGEGGVSAGGATGPSCGDKTCAADEQCIEYYGVAGPRGPKFKECGIPCPDGKCPEGKACQTIADGPGPVCR